MWTSINAYYIKKKGKLLKTHSNTPSIPILVDVMSNSVIFAKPDVLVTRASSWTFLPLPLRWPRAAPGFQLACSVSGHAPPPSLFGCSSETDHAPPPSSRFLGLLASSPWSPVARVLLAMESGVAGAARRGGCRAGAARRGGRVVPDSKEVAVGDVVPDSEEVAEDVGEALDSVEGLDSIEVLDSMALDSITLQDVEPLDNMESLDSIEAEDNVEMWKEKS